AQSFQGLTRELGSGNSSAGNGTHAHPHGNEILRTFGVHSEFIVQKCDFHLLFVEMGGAESGTIELVFLREEKLGCASFKALHKVVRNGVHQLDDVAFPEELPAEAVQALHFAPALMRLMGFFANTRREPAAGYRGDQKRKQSYPVLRI